MIDLFSFSLRSLGFVALIDLPAVLSCAGGGGGAVVYGLLPHFLTKYLSHIAAFISLFVVLCDKSSHRTALTPQTVDDG